MRQTTKKNLCVSIRRFESTTNLWNATKTDFCIASPHENTTCSATHTLQFPVKKSKQKNVLHQLHVLFPSLSGRLHLDRARLQEGVRRRHRGQGGAGGGKEDTGETRIPTCLKKEQKNSAKLKGQCDVA